MRKFIFTTILLFLALGQVWARTYSGGEILYVRNYRPSEWGSGTDNWKQSGGEFWATFDASETQVKPSRLEPTGDWNNAGTVYCFVVPDGEHTTVTLHRGNDYSGSSWSGKTSAITLDATKNYIYDGYNTDASTANWQDLPMFSNGSTMYLIRGWNWSQSNERYAAYFFDGVNSEWVDLTNHSGDIFKCTIPTRKWAYMIMCRMNGSKTDNNWSNKWMQTQNIAPSGTGNCVYITDKDPDNGTATSNWRLGKYAATPAITGGMNDWSPVANQFSGSPLQLTMSLSAGKAYQFKVALGEDNSWYGRNDTYDNDLVFVGQTDAETLYSGEHNLMLMTAEAGTYTFEWNSEDHKLTITYPSAGNHPSANYYYIAKNASSTSGWNSGYFIYLNFWNGSGPLATWNTDEPRLEYATEIDGENYYYVPVLTDYTSFKAHEKKDGSSGYTTGDQTLAGHAGQFIDCVESTWGWHDFSFKVEEHNNGGSIWSDSIGSYTFGVGATLPTNITKWGYDFAGWYDNPELSGEPVTAISTTDNGDKDYYAKWTSIAQTYPIAEHPEFLAAQEGDIIAVTVTGVHTSAAIYLKDANYTDIANLSISATGTYTFQLSAEAATGIRTYGLQVTGQNFTFSDVDILYRKEIWSGTLNDNTGWAEVDVDKSIFSGMSGGDFLGFNVTTLGDGKDWHTYAMRADYVQQLSGSCTATGIAVEQLSAANITAISDSKTSVDINAQYLDVSNLYSYTHTRVYDVTLNTNSGTINSGDVTSYTFGTGATLPTDVTRTGYTFAGWYPDEDFKEERVYTISTTDYGAKTYYAKWTVNTYDITLNLNDGTVNDGDVTSYTYGVGATLPTDVTKWGYKFDGWYGNSTFEGDAVTAISTSDYGNKEYWAKWTSISETMSSGSHPEFLAAEEGDILVITVTNVQPSAQIFLANTSSVEIDHKSISTTGKYAFQLSASAATALHNGVIITGVNYTKSSVALLYKKTIWSGTLTSPKDAEPWQVQSLTQSDFADIADGDYVGFTVSSINDGETWHQYSLYYYDSNNQLVKSNTQSTTGTFLEAIPDGKAAGLADGDNAVFIVAQYLTLTGFHRYISTRDYTVTLNTNSGTINADDVTGYTYPIGATLPTNVTRDGYRFDGWFANEGLTGEPVTTITTSDYGNKTYWAKWTSLEQTKTPANYSRLNVAEAGDILVVNVTAISAGSSIKINKSEDGSNLFTKAIAATGKYAFQLSASDATALHTGMILSGTNYTGTVELLYRKTIWHGELVSPDAEKNVWITADLTHSDLAGIADGDYVGFTVSAINTGEFHQYNLCAYKDPDTYIAANNTTADEGTYIETIKSGFATHLLNEDNSVFIAAQNLTLTDFYRYLTTRDYTVTLNTNGGTINAGNITSYTYGVGATLPTNVTRTNYTFDGWYDNAELTGSAVTSITTSDLGNKTYYAKWKFVIYRTGDKENDSQIESFDGGEVSEIIEYRMKVHELDRWYSLCLPFTVNAVKVWDDEDGEYYDLVPYYRTGGTFYLGHYVIRTPNTATDFPIADFNKWNDPTTYDGFVPSKNTPYIIQWHDAYFEGKYISFFGAAGQTIPTSMTVGAAPTADNVVNVYGNDAMVSGTVRDAYLLEGDYGSDGAWLRAETTGVDRTVLPFECYIRASSAATPRYRVLRRGMAVEDTATGWDDVLNSERKAHIMVYTLTGFPVTQFSDCSFGEAASRLNMEQNEGIYILRSDNESVKLMVGGK